MTKRAPLFIVLGALAVVVIWFLVIFSPKGDDLSAANARRDAAKSQEQVLQTQLKQLQSLQAERPALDAEKLRLAAAIPSTPDLAGFILSANQIATTSGIDWLSIAPSPPAAAGVNQPSVIAVSIQVQGGFFQVLDYLNRFEALPRLVVVDAISVAGGASNSTTTGSTTSASATTLSVTLTGRAFTSAAPSGGATPGGSTTTTAPGATTTTTTPSTTTTRRAG